MVHEKFLRVQVFQFSVVALKQIASTLFICVLVVLMMILKRIICTNFHIYNEYDLMGSSQCHSEVGIIIIIVLILQMINLVFKSGLVICSRSPV